MPAGESVIRLFLVRHGRVHNPRRLAYGYLPRMGLDPSGRAQAERAGTWLCSWRPVAVYTSPLLRALQTTRAILPRLLGCADVAGASGPTGPLAPAGPPVHRSSLLRESELARYWQGTPIDERPARFPEEWRLFSQTPSRSTAGETLADQAARMERALRAAARRYGGGAIVFVSHRDPITALRLTVEGRPLDDLHVTACEPGSIIELTLAGGRLWFNGYVEP